MGGKNKPNRTKNNTRPSSSARSAELLGNQPATFLGFGITHDKNAPVTFTTMDIDGSAGNFQIVLKKMTKKDATTKLKALQEFSDICCESETDAVKATLPYWSRIYCQLCGDADHRVREAAHISHKSVIAKVKKYLAPYLKEIIGPWFTSQFDTHAPSASAAVAAFQEAFSLQKFAEAIAFCQDEILAYYFENLTVHTPQSLNNAKTCSNEEMEEKYRRVVTSSLLGYASYLQKLTKEQILACEEANRKLVSSAKFWKLGQNKDPLIRHGFFTVLASLCEHASWLVQNEAPRLSAMLFNNVAEDDPIVLPVLWDAVLIGVVAVPECWKHGNVAKQLNQILKSGGRGHASSIFPKVLPLLSAIPAEKMGDPVKFLNLLFSNMRTGMSEPSVGRSRSESLTVARTFIESFQYFIMLNRDDEALVQQLIEDHLLSTIKTRLLEPPPVHGTTMPLFYNISQLIRSWCRNITNYESPVKQFWQGIQDIFTTCLDSQLFAENAELTLKFMAILQKPENFISKNGKDRVKFSDEEQTNELQPTTESETVFDKHLQHLAEVLANSFIEKFQANEDQRILDAYLGLKKIFPSFDSCGTETLCKLFFSLVQKSYPTTMLTELCMLMLPHLSNETGEKMLDTISPLENLDLLQYCQLLPCSNNWTQNPNFHRIYFKLLDQYLLGEVGINGADGLCKFLHPVLYLEPATYAQVLKKLTWAVTAQDVDHTRIKVLIESCNRDMCLSEQFRDFAVAVFSAVSINGDMFASLFSFTLRKIKCFWSPELLWDDLAQLMKNRVLNTDWKVDNLLLAVNTVIDVAFSVDLTDSCEADEIREVVMLVKTFLEFPQDLKRCGKYLQCEILKSREVLGQCDLKYFELKVENLKSGNLNSNDVQDFIKWLRFSTILILELAVAYPVSVKASDVFRKNGKNLDLDEDNNEYPDEELLRHISDQIVDVIGYVLALEMSLLSCTELEFYPVILNYFQELMGKMQEFIAATTPSDYGLVYSMCSKLVREEPFWHTLKNVVSLVFKRDLDEGDSSFCDRSRVEEALSTLDDPAKMLEFSALLGEHYQHFTMEIWNKLFVQLDTMLKRTEAQETSMLKLGAISNLFLIMQQHFKFCEENDLEKEHVLVWDNVAEKELWMQIYYKWRQFTPIWKPNHDDPVNQKRSFGSSPLRRFCEAFTAGLDMLPKEDSEKLIHECVPLLLCSQVSVQASAFDVLLRLIEDWVQDDMELFQANITETPDNDDKWLVNQKMNCDWRMVLLSEVLGTSQTVVEALLSDFKAGDTCTIQPFTDAFTYAHGYLLTWTAIYKMCSLAHVALRFQYASWLKKYGHLWILLDSVVKLMPANAVHGEPNKEISLLFKDHGALSLQEAPCSLWIEHRACHLFRMSLQWVAGAVREWWSELEHPIANLVARIASDHVSPLLISAELKAVQNYSDSTMTIAVSHQAREIIANYPIDDTIVQLALNVPPNYPLGTIKVESKTQNFVHRTLRVSLFLANRNCSLCDALLLWKSELDKRFEGIEPCHICYSLFYGDNCELPKPSCSTCHKKFHSACLYKWFDTSNKSTCPYCRNKF